MKSRAVYPGSFDPVTYGHIDIIERSASVFDKVIVAVFINPAKEPLFSREERVQLLEESVGKLSDNNIIIDSFSGLTTDYVKKQNAGAIIRGLRAISDFEGEFQMASMNKQLNANIETIFFMTDTKYSFLSSSVIKEVAQFGGDVSDLVPDCIREALYKKYDVNNSH